MHGGFSTNLLYMLMNCLWLDEIDKVIELTIGLEALEVDIVI